MTELPPAFCWTKIGVESGEDLNIIIRRKEWERQLGEGYFFWGIGQHVAKSAQAATGNAEPLPALFSPMLSKPKAIDISPGKIVLWNGWMDARGYARPLPMHCLVTSRAFLPSGKKKERHYALVCFSNRDLNEQQADICVVPRDLRNTATGRHLGASQVTAVVRKPHLADNFCDARSYSVSFTAQLRAPYCVRLAQPMLLNAGELADMQAISALNDILSWEAFVKCLRSRAMSQLAYRQLSLNLAGSPLS